MNSSLGLSLISSMSSINGGFDYNNTKNKEKIKFKDLNFDVDNSNNDDNHDYDDEFLVKSDNPVKLENVFKIRCFR